ncbi:TPA: type II toxin-antitoxin system RelB/DinJ family antitoxin [Streptococcus suis]|uniref:type II toxin-antitoxin system RelB/DinJ family antitoxin n=1 Tax=Streptococcus suis TaxID=1307 RepID=UPI001EE86EC0|nr:type II toxin-antitoxin system RelB/DinJ family antitoxin [Streptococcus suis]MBS8022144.1 type II toxin-antitoxin system RelB/DinJ family antitoxin [Streptococcus suis]MDG3308858.1 type II toxin-antitoxin system RelB/DinJ family antitoxin [Streptococcus suis]HEM3022407.1 type II toxin-antitoxin system RelB/DinJ family antitoxin [Streptococcus suis]HEM3023147.1 type II toxin-antitoxin system RelB/DinJ family antitoxin [Streptococcus suis]
MRKTATLNVRVDSDDKSNAESVLKELGMPMSTLITLLLKQVSMTRSIPFDIALPQAPASVDVSSLSAGELKDMLVQSYHAADQEETILAEDFFKGIKGVN